MDNNTKLPVVMDLLNKEIAKVNSKIAINSNIELITTLNYLLNLRDEIFSGNISGIDEFLEKYKENKL